MVSFSKGHLLSQKQSSWRDRKLGKSCRRPTGMKKLLKISKYREKRSIQEVEVGAGELVLSISQVFLLLENLPKPFSFHISSVSSPFNSK